MTFRLHTFVQFICQSNASVLTAGAADCNNQTVFAFFNIIRDQKLNHVGQLVQEYSGLRKTHHIILHSFIITGLTQIECVQKSSGIITELNITLSFWDNYPVSYAFKNNDTSLLNERQLTLYDSYINTLAQITSPDNTQWQNELAIHDYLVSHITYTDGIPGNSYAYNAMIDGTAVCSGYAESFKTFMDFLGIENITVSGTARGEKHIWNMVCLDGEWYHTDVTWDDPVNGREDYIEHAYFNITDNDISLDHSWEYSSTPAASADIYSYKSIAGLANIADISTLNSIVTSAVNRREPFVEFTSSIPLDVTDAFTNINTNLTYYYKNTVRNGYTLYSIIFSY